MNRAKVKHLKDANDMVTRAQRDKEAAIYYRNLDAQHYRIACTHDASAASAAKNYAQEGVIVVLMADYLDVESNHVIATDEFADSRLSGKAQLLHMQSNKAKRVSYSTSHGETLAAINGLECATLVSSRLAEITYGDAGIFQCILTRVPRTSGNSLQDRRACRKTSLSDSIFWLIVKHEPVVAYVGSFSPN